MGHLSPPTGPVARLLQYDDFSRSYRLKPVYVATLWLLGAAMVVSWIVAVW